MEVVAVATGRAGHGGWGGAPAQAESVDPALLLLIPSPVQMERTPYFLGLAMCQGSTEPRALMSHPFPPTPKGWSYASVLQKSEAQQTGIQKVHQPPLLGLKLRKQHPCTVIAAYSPLTVV